MSDPTLPADDNDKAAEGAPAAPEPTAAEQPAPPASEQPAPEQPASPAPEQPAPPAPQQPVPPVAAEQQPAYAAAPGPQQPYAGQPNPYAPPAGEKKKPAVPHWVWWVIGGAVAFAAVAIVAIVVIANLLGGGGAKAVAQDYLNDIAKGNASAANKLARVEASEGENFLLTNAVLGKAQHITAPVVSRTLSSRSSDLTQASVTYKLAGKTYRGTIELDKDDKGWYVSRGLTYNVPFVSSSIPGYSVPGAEHSLTSKDSEVVAYPGVYSIQAPNKYYELAGSPKLTVAADSYQVKDLKLTPSQAYLDEVQKQVDAHYAECAAKTAYYDVEDCGIDLSYPSNMSVSKSTVAVTVDESPKVEISDDSDSYYQFKIGPGKFSAVMTGSDYSGNPASENLTGQAGYISADIKIDDDKVVVTFN